MPFSSALTSDQLEALRGTASVNPAYAASEYAIFCPNTVVFKALVNGAPTGTSYAQLTFDTVTTGAYTDIVVGQTVLVGSDSDIRNATFVGRVRKAPTSSILYVNETSASLLDNANIWVINDFRVWDRLARQSGSTQFKDYDLTFTTPAPLIYGLQSAYAGIADVTTDVLTLSFAPNALPITSGATINGATWVWTVPSGMAITVGNSTTQNITAEFDAGFASWVSVQVNDSNGKTGVFHFFVGVVASDLSNVINLNIVPGGIQGDENGWTAGVEAFAGIDTMLDNTLVVLFDVERYNGAETNILSNVKLVGRIRKESNSTASDPTYSQLKNATLDIEGTLAQFGRIEHLPFTLLNKASPTKFDEITNLTLWRAVAYTLQWHSTYLTLHSLTFDSTDTTFLYLGIPTQGGNILSVVQDIATSNNATIESAPQGETRVYRNGVYLSGAQRAALVTVADFGTQDYINIESLDVTEVDSTGKIQGSGGFYNSVSGKVTPLLSLAPGVAQGIGEGITSFTRQVLAANVSQATAQAELNTRTGHEFAAKRDEGTYLTVTMPPGYNFLVPSRSQWYTWTLAATDTTGGRAFTDDDRWQLFSVSYQHDNAAGTKSPIQATFKLETSGTPGQTVVYPPQTQIAPIIPVVVTAPPFPTFPPPPSIIVPEIPTIDDTPPFLGNPAVSNGNLVMTWTEAGVWIAQDLFLTNTPSWVEITPEDGLTYSCAQWLRLGSKGAYVIAHDGVDSTFFYTEDALSPGAVWTETALSGIYTLIRVGSTQGVVYVSKFDAGAGEEVFDFTVDDYGWLAVTDAAFSPTNLANYTAGVGFEEQASAGVAFPANRFSQSAIEYTLPESSEITAITMYYTGLNKGNDADPLGDNPQAIFFVDGVLIHTEDNLTAGAGTSVWTGSETGSVLKIQLDIGFRNDSVACTGVGTIWKMVITRSTNSVITRYSDEFGETFENARTVGDFPGAFAGLDTEKIGTVALAGTDGQVMKAISGGAWAAYGDPFPAGAQPSCIIIPRYKSNGSSNTGANPDYIAYSASLTAGNEAAWYVSGSGTVFTSITKNIGGEYGLAVSPNCADASYKVYNRYAAALLFDTEVHMITSVNAGGAWSDRGQVADDAAYLRYRLSDTAGNQLFLADGTDGIIVSPSHGSNLLDGKAVPSSDPFLGLEAY